MPKSILFDLDGTLTDSGEGVINCAWYALEHFKLPLPDKETMRAFVGPPLHESFPRFGVPQESVEEAIKVYRSRYNTIGRYENFPYPGIQALLERLQQDGHTLYVATSKPEKMSVEILEDFGLARYFTRICGASYDASRSTKAAVIAYLLTQMPEGASLVMVGDTSYDVIGAKAHGIDTIGVSWGYGSEESLKNAGAIAVARNMDELYHLLSR